MRNFLNLSYFLLFEREGKEKKERKKKKKVFTRIHQNYILLFFFFPHIFSSYLFFISLFALRT
jgi:hypothetical protein